MHQKTRAPAHRRARPLQRLGRRAVWSVALLSGVVVFGGCEAPPASQAGGSEGTEPTAGGAGAPAGDPQARSYPHPADLAAQIAEALDPNDLRVHAEAIVAHERPSGSDGENAAIDYVVTTLRESGVPVRVEEFRALVSTPVSATLQVAGSDYSPDAITMAYSGPARGVVADLVDVGSLADLPRLEVGTGERLDIVGSRLPANVDRSDLPDLQGKIALVTGQARNGPTTVLQELGAAGVVYVNPEERVNDLIVTSTWGSPSLRNFHRLPTLPVAHVARSAGDSLRTLLRSGSVQVTMDVDVDTGWKTLRLAVAEIRPDDRPNGPYVLFGGHIDAWYHGGTDEGASNAAMVSLAQAFHEHRDSLRRGLVVAWWPGHSNGRYAGSTWFADRYAKELRDRALAYVNVDGIGQQGASEYAAATTASLARVARAVLVEGASAPVEPTRPGTNSDQSFNGIGLPLLQLYHGRSPEDRGTWWWHTPDDTFDKIDFNILEGDAELYAAALAELTVAQPFPVDLVAQAAAAGEALAQRGEEADGRLELGSARAAHLRLSRAFAELQSTLSLEHAQGVVGLDRDVVAVLRPLHRVLYVEGSAHHPDAGRGLGPLPGLAAGRILTEEDPASDRYGFAETLLMREVNRTVEAFDQSSVRANDLIEKIKGNAGDN